MQRKNTTYAILAGIALVAWMTCGSLLYASQCCTPATNQTYTGQLLIQDGSDFKIEHNEVMAFVKNSEQLILSETVSEELFKVVRYIKSNPVKRLTIIGLYLESESGGSTLGRARAEAMKNVFLASGTPDYQIRTEIGRRDGLPEDESGTVLLGGIDFVFDCLDPFEISDPAYRFSVKAADNFVFDYNSAQFLMPLSKVMETKVGDIATYLKEHVDRQFKIIGYNHPDEAHYGALPNLGLARANRIRSVLIEAGAPPSQLVVDGVADERLEVLVSELYDEFLPNALGFKFETLSEARVKALEKRVIETEEALKKRQVFRFKDFGLQEEKIVVDEELKAYLNELILYLSSRPNAVVYIVGHSNTLETKAKSALKGKERADYVRDFLVEQGISSQQISTTTAGDSHPLGKRETRYGQQINRRVDLFVSYDGQQPQLYALPPVTKEEKKKEKKKRKSSSKPAVVSSDSVATPVTPEVEETPKEVVPSEEEPEEEPTEKSLPKVVTTVVKPTTAKQDSVQ